MGHPPLEVSLAGGEDTGNPASRGGEDVIGSTSGQTRREVINLESEKGRNTTEPRAALQQLIYEQEIPDWGLSRILRGEKGEEILSKYNSVVDKVCEIYPDPESIFPVFVEVYSEAELTSSELYDLAEKTGKRPSDLERERELRIDVMTDAAEKVGMDDFDIRRAHYKSYKEEDRQQLFEMQRDDGFTNLTYEQVGKLMGEFELVW